MRAFTSKNILNVSQLAYHNLFVDGWDIIKSGSHFFVLYVLVYYIAHQYSNILCILLYKKVSSTLSKDLPTAQLSHPHDSIFHGIALNIR